MISWMRKTLIAVVMMHIAGCSSLPSINPMNWWASDSGPKVAELPAIKDAVSLRVIWQSNLGSSRAAVFSPVLAGGGVYGAAADGVVTKIDAGTGRAVWKAVAAKDLTGGVGTDGSLVAVGTADGEVIALEADSGAVRWRARVSSEVLAAPAVTGELVLVRSADSRIFALDAKDGRRRWVYQRSAPALAVRSRVGLVVSRGNAYAGFSGGKLVAIALSNGGVRWEATVAVPKGSNELDRVTDIVGLPWVSEREVCAVAFQGRIACFDLSSGNPLWAREMSSVSGLAGDARFVFVIDDKGAVHALDRATGTSIWKQDKLYLRNLTAPLPLGRQIAVADIQGYVHVIDRNDGTLEGRIATDGSAISATPILLESGLLVQTRAGNLFALSLQ
jgi:outer membrane protein assembly factor BamB